MSCSCSVARRATSKQRINRNRRVMNDQDYREHAERARNIASFADPFTKKRLLDLAERYDAKRVTRQTPLPGMSVTAEEAG
jgi:hypothetical protein